eukprot:4371354-Pleurochrysis_carterae.AAC.1
MDSASSADTSVHTEAEHETAATALSLVGERAGGRQRRTPAVSAQRTCACALGAAGDASAAGVVRRERARRVR